MTLIKKITAISLCVTLSSCGDKKKEDEVETKAKSQQAEITHESVRENYIIVLSEMSDTLSKIKDKETALSVIPELTKIGFRMQTIKTDIAKLGLPPKNVEASLKKKYNLKMKTILVEIGDTMNRLKASNPEAYGMVDKVMSGVLK